MKSADPLNTAFTIVGSICIVTLILAGATMTAYLGGSSFGRFLVTLGDVAWAVYLVYLCWKILTDGHTPHEETLQAPRRGVQGPHFH